MEILEKKCMKQKPFLTFLFAKVDFSLKVANKKFGMRNQRYFMEKLFECYYEEIDKEWKKKLNFLKELRS